MAPKIEKKYIKIGIASLAVVALVIGLSVGLTQSNKNGVNASASSSNANGMDYDKSMLDHCSTTGGSGKSGKSGGGSSGSSSGKSGKSGGDMSYSSGKSGKSGGGSSKGCSTGTGKSGKSGGSGSGSGKGSGNSSSDEPCEPRPSPSPKPSICEPTPCTCANILVDDTPGYFLAEGDTVCVLKLDRCGDADALTKKECGDIIPKTNFDDSACGNLPTPCTCENILDGNTPGYFLEGDVCVLYLDRCGDDDAMTGKECNAMTDGGIDNSVCEPQPMPTPPLIPPVPTPFPSGTPPSPTFIPPAPTPVPTEQGTETVAKETDEVETQTGDRGSGRV